MVFGEQQTLFYPKPLRKIHLVCLVVPGPSSEHVGVDLHRVLPWPPADLANLLGDKFTRPACNRHHHLKIIKIASILSPWRAAGYILPGKYIFLYFIYFSFSFDKIYNTQAFRRLGILRHNFNSNLNIYLNKLPDS